MVAIARALLNDNRILLVDEPTKGLAPLLVTEVARALERVCRADDGAARRAEPRRRPPRRASTSSCSTPGRVVHTGPARELLDDRERVHALLGVGALPEARMSTFVLLDDHRPRARRDVLPVASGLSLIYGLMGVLNFAHGAFLTVGAYATWFTETKLERHRRSLPRFLLARARRARRRRACSRRSSSSC